MKIFKKQNYYDKATIHHYLLKLISMVRSMRFDVPDLIGFEVSTACNRRCWYCPQSQIDAKQQIVSPELWDLFINRLKEFNYKGIVGVTWISELSIVPNSELYIKKLVDIGCLPLITTNGDNPEIIEKWLQAGAFKITITRHEPIKDGWDKAINELRKKWRFKISVKNLNYVHTNHLKYKPYEPKNSNSKIDNTPLQKCYAVHALSISINGDVCLCCNDWEHNIKFGNIKDFSLKELWNNETLKTARKKVSKGIPAYKLCSKACSLGE